MTRILTLVTIGSVAAVAWGQEVVSARAGLIHYVEGRVTVDGKSTERVANTKLFSQFPEVKEGSTLQTTEGRAEILLSPGAVLRVGEDSTVKMLSSKLTDIRLELLSGEAVIDIAELLKENNVSIRIKDSTIMPRRTGTYKLTAEPAELMVFEGQANVVAGDTNRVVRKGNALALGPELVARKFDTEKGDSLIRWSARRSGYLAMANVSAAKSMYDSGSTYSSGMWRWNPYFGMYTYIPIRGSVCNSYFGYCYYNPARVYAVYYSPRVMATGGGGGGYNGPSIGYNPNLGYNTSSGRSYGGYSGSSGGVSTGAPAAAAPAASPRAAESAAPRSSGGGGRSQ